MGALRSFVSAFFSFPFLKPSIELSRSFLSPVAFGGGAPADGGGGGGGGGPGILIYNIWILL